MGAISAQGVVTDAVEDLYDYDVVRNLKEASLFVVHLNQPTLVLGGSQSTDALIATIPEPIALRRRRGGGGLVLLHPGDLWIDWWIPVGDVRWRSDVRSSAVQVGQWWSDALAEHTEQTFTVHAGALQGVPAHRVVCFAGRGPGEVFENDRKAVGLTQWRVREGSFISTVLPSAQSLDVLSLLARVPEGLAEALDHHTVDSLDLSDPENLIVTLASDHGHWSVRELFLTL